MRSVGFPTLESVGYGSVRRLRRRTWPHPRRSELRDVREDRTPLLVRAGEVAAAEEERAGDLAAGEDERVPEQAHPFVFRARVVRVEPGGEAAVRLAELDDAPRVLDRRIDLEPIANDARVFEQTFAPFVGEARYAIDVEIRERRAEVVALFQDRQPRQTGFIDLQHEPFEQRVVVRDREAVLVIVIWPVKRMARRNVAVTHPALRSSIVVENDWSPTSR